MASIQEARELERFIELENKGTADIVFVPSERFHVTLIGREEDLKRTYTDVHGDRLIVWQDSQNGISFFGVFSSTVHSIGPVTVTVEAPTLQKIELLGTGKFKCTAAPIICNSMKLSIVGTSQLEIDKLTCHGDAEFTISGMGDIDVSGSVDGNVKATLNGMGNIKGNLTYATVKREKHGIGEISI